MTTASSARTSLADYQQLGVAPLDRLYVAGIGNATALVTGALAANRLVAMPFVAANSGNASSLNFAVTTAIAASNGRIGLYEATSPTNLYPNALLAGSGAISLAAVGLKTFLTSVSLKQGKLYWLAYVQSAAVTLRAMSLATAYPIFGSDNALGTTQGVGLTVAFPFAALPPVFPAGAAALSAVPIPALAIKI